MPETSQLTALPVACSRQLRERPRQLLTLRVAANVFLADQTESGFFQSP